MPDIFGNPQRRGASGRIPDSRADGYQKYVNERYTCPPDLHARLLRYAEEWRTITKSSKENEAAGPKQK